jgi:hypothetical protein
LFLSVIEETAGFKQSTKHRSLTLDPPTEAALFFLWCKLALKPALRLVRCHRIGAVAVEALPGTLAFAFRRQRQLQLTSALGTDTLFLHGGALRCRMAAKNKIGWLTVLVRGIAEAALLFFHREGLLRLAADEGVYHRTVFKSFASCRDRIEPD